MAVTAAQVTVATTETSLALAGSAAMQVVVGHRGGAPGIFIGPTGVTITTGFEVAQGKDVTVLLAPGDELFGIVAAATEEVNVLRS